MIPKSLALQKSEAVMFFLIGPMLFFMKVFRPIIFILNGMNNFLLRNLMGIDRSKSTFPAFSSDEIQLIIKESESEGIISDEIGSVIEQLFDFGELVAEDIMVPRVHILAVPIRPTKAQVLEIVSQANHSRYPVYAGDKDNIVGTVHVKDLAAFLEARDDRTLIIRQVPFVPQSSTLQSVLESMRQFRTHLAVVLDEHGGTAGIISIQDIFGEVIGEIDESATPPPIATIDSKSVRVLGTVRLEQLAGYLGLVIEEDVGTISGLVLDQLGRPPRVGDRFNFKNLSIEVTNVKGRGAQSCIVTVLSDA
jgi:CBS domain containing-hemolysin-like protein